MPNWIVSQLKKASSTLHCSLRLIVVSFRDQKDQNWGNPSRRVDPPIIPFQIRHAHSRCRYPELQSARYELQSTTYISIDPPSFDSTCNLGLEGERVSRTNLSKFSVSFLRPESVNSTNPHKVRPKSTQNTAIGTSVDPYKYSGTIRPPFDPSDAIFTKHHHSTSPDRFVKKSIQRGTLKLDRKSSETTFETKLSTHKA